MMLPCQVEEFDHDESIMPVSQEQSLFDEKPLVDYDPLFKGGSVDNSPPVYQHLTNVMDSTSIDPNMDNLDYFLGERIVSLSEIDFTTKHPDHWRKEETVTWVQTILIEKEIPFEHFCLEAFNKSGIELRAMSLRDFKELDCNYGEEIYKNFQQLIREHQPQLNREHGFTPSTYEAPQWSTLGIRTEISFSDMLADPSKMLSFDPDDRFPSIRSLDQRLPSVDTFARQMHVDSFYSPSADSGSETLSEPPSPRSIAESDDNTVKDKSKPKGNHLWQFVRDLLLDSRYNPHLIKWEDKERGVFKFVKSDKVAALWGKKKNNSNMNYEKMSRAMRFCRAEGWFTTVPKDKKFPKKLCFSFGPKSSGWNL